MKENNNNENNSNNKKRKKRNMARLGGGTGLSLEAFINAKSPSNHYNPSLIKKEREFYKKAKFVSKLKRKLKHEQTGDVSASSVEREKESGEGSKMNEEKKKKKKKKSAGSNSLRELYEEKEKARMEKEAIIQAKKEEREKTEARRKAEREKMYKKTRFGQPIMKYRIQHLLQTIQGSN